MVHQRLCSLLECFLQGVLVNNIQLTVILEYIITLLLQSLVFCISVRPLGILFTMIHINGVAFSK